jgi:D-isomer specific 2-hydroxyacid dehydrogenase, catalytic domain
MDKQCGKGIAPPMRVAILDDIHRAYATAPAIRQLRERAEVRIFTQAFGSPAALQGFEALVANRERTHFTRDFLDQLPDLRILVQTGSHATHIDLKAAEERNIIVAKAAVFVEGGRACHRADARRDAANPRDRCCGQGRQMVDADDAGSARQGVRNCRPGQCRTICRPHRQCL